jgi:hypothetical protein
MSLGSQQYGICGLVSRYCIYIYSAEDLAKTLNDLCSFSEDDGISNVGGRCSVFAGQIFDPQEKQRSSLAFFV